MDRLRAFAPPVKPSSYRVSITTDDGRVFLSLPWDSLEVAESIIRFSLLDAEVLSASLFMSACPAPIYTLTRAEGTA